MEQRHPSPAAAYLAAALAASLMGLMGVLVRRIPLPAEAIALGRFGLGFVFLVLHRALVQRSLFPRRLSAWSMLAGLWLGLCCLCYFKAVLLTSLGTAAILLYLGPLLATLLALPLLGEAVTLLNSLCLGLAFLGCLLIFGLRLDLAPDALQGNLYALLSALFYAGFILANRRTAAGVSPLDRAFQQLLFAALTLLPGAVISLQGQTLPGAGALSGLPWLLVLGLLDGFLSVFLMAVAMERLRAVQYGTVSYLEPVIAGLAGLTLYGEVLGLTQCLGGLLILGGSAGQALLPPQKARASRPSVQPPLP